MNRILSVVETPLFSVTQFDHRPDQIHGDPPKETAHAYSISFVKRSTFDLCVGGRSWRLDPSVLFITWPGLEYRCRHAEKKPGDVCLTITYKDQFVESIQQQMAAPKWDLNPVIQRSNRLGYLGLCLAALTTRRGDLLALETLAGELFGDVAGHEIGVGKKRFGDSQLTWYAQRVEAARFVLEKQFAEAHSLASLARGVGMSPFHFTRVFRELVGTPPHRYLLLEIRLKRAAERLQHGASVTRTCFDCGLNSLSHFIRLFRRRFGVSPSRFRDSAHTSPARK